MTDSQYIVILEKLVSDGLDEVQKLEAKNAALKELLFQQDDAAIIALQRQRCAVSSN